MYNKLQWHTSFEYFLYTTNLNFKMRKYSYYILLRKHLIIQYRPTVINITREHQLLKISNFMIIL